MGYNYNSLADSIIAYTENTGVEFVTELPSIIGHAVRAVARETDIIGLNAVTTVSTVLSQPFVQLPNECLLLHTVAYVSGTSKSFLKRRPYDYIVTYWPDYSQTSKPLFYDRINDEQIYVGPTPNSDSPIELRYVTVSIPTSANPDSYILTRYPELVLYRSMVGAHLFNKNQTEAQLWQQVYDRARESAENEARRNRRDDGSTPIMGKIGSNTLKGGS